MLVPDIIIMLVQDWYSRRNWPEMGSDYPSNHMSLCSIDLDVINQGPLRRLAPPFGFGWAYLGKILIKDLIQHLPRYLLLPGRPSAPEVTFLEPGSESPCTCGIVTRPIKTRTHEIAFCLIRFRKRYCHEGLISYEFSICYGGVLDGERRHPSVSETF